MTQRSGWEAHPDWISLIVSPDELDAMITSGGNRSSSCPYSAFLKSMRSGPFSWMRSAPTTAVSILGVNDNCDCDAPGARPRRLRAGHAASTNRFRAASAFGAISVATTSRPLARYSAAQLAPMTPVPMIVTRRMGWVVDIFRSPFDQVQIYFSTVRVARGYSRRSYLAIRLSDGRMRGFLSCRHGAARMQRADFTCAEPELLE